MTVPNHAPASDSQLIEFINLKLAAMGQPIHGRTEDFAHLSLSRSLIANYQEKSRLLVSHLCPVDQSIDSFLRAYLGEAVDHVPALVPVDTFTLDQPGLARVLCLPPDADAFESPALKSYRVAQGVLHNPEKDRRTTEGVFHVTEGGLPIPADKKAVPKNVFAKLLETALRPPPELTRLPFTGNQKEQAHVWVSLLMRPIVSPEIPGYAEEKSIEVRFFAPGGLVANLDFVESIFGNAGDPFLPQNDARLDIEHWSGQTGCVILAPHLVRQRKKDLGLPHVSEATDRQKRDRMCWEKEDELYNDGGAFKITCRDHRGIVVTLIADTYFGYCKKEVKTQISYSANLHGMAEEEHAGGAIAFPAYDLGEDFRLSEFVQVVDHTFDELLARHASRLELHPDGYAVDNSYPDIRYVPEDAFFSLQTQTITWTRGGEQRTIRLQPHCTYVLPSGYKVEMVKPATVRRWRLVGTTAEGTFCHKPCTVSGGGKSEISKSIADAMIAGPVFVGDLESDFDQVEKIIDREYGQRFRDASLNRPTGRPLLSPKRSLGSVVKLLTPSPEYTDEYNDWLRTIPERIRDLVFIVKRLYKPDWEGQWRERFTADLIDNHPGNELKYRELKLLTRYLRVGFAPGGSGSWRTFSLRRDFMPAAKIQTEDDISATAVAPASAVAGLNPDQSRPAWKFVTNCESRLFQRPDDAIHRGYDKKTEWDFSQPGNFFSNYEPLRREFIDGLVEETIRFDQFTRPMQNLLRGFRDAGRPEFVVSSAHPRLVDGVPSKNPRYLQLRPDLENPRHRYLAELGTRLYRRIPEDRGVPMPVNAVLPGRRNNPPEKGVRPLCVYGPIHYQELPEFFMDAIASLTGKSPSTTGAGSEGALTKGPFNALPPIIDLNNALVAYLLTGYAPFSTAAGWVGPKYKVDHDVSLLVPEIWSRMTPAEREPAFLIANGLLEKCEDFEHEGKLVQASRLGYRITDRFARRFFGRVFSNPGSVLPEEMLRPEKQDLAIFVDGMDNIVATQKRVAELYFEDGSVEDACPPLKALLHIMAHGHFEGKSAADPDIREMFTREALLGSEWYRARLESRLRFERRQREQQVRYLERFSANPIYRSQLAKLEITERLQKARAALAALADVRPEALEGTIGRDPALDVG
ncbi:hypothetical protein ASA1KI_02960 [Opitutales bacterium ASA1]|uniref:hypothetical protein n=1 Tax=Congregicoccus parvus TaxID=3081749 RepID=UPI002B311946|nr:hypothetical protein ASA1KI_02960 [Opitutales bacterium ASA1]